MKLNLAIVQMDCEIKAKEKNIRKAEDFINQIGTDSDMVVLPEFFSTGYDFGLIQDKFYSLAETIPGPTVERLAKKAKQLQTAIIGNIVEKDAMQEGVLYDTTFLIDNQGKYCGKYRKVHLYPTEHQYFRSGEELPVFDIGGTKVGFATCYDHAFGELFRILAMKGAEVVFIPSAVPKGYEYLLNLRTRARAQDNQIFAVACNRAGNDGEIEWCGLSKIVDPRGEIVCEAGGGEGVLKGTIDTEQILKERKQEPILRGLRPEVYGI